MRHADLWRAIDTLAAERGLSPSGLARRAGLDPTSFNPSKRRTTDGRPRWPSTESIAKMLAASETDLASFAALIAGARALPPSERLRRRDAAQRIPLLGFAEACEPGAFDAAGYPSGRARQELLVPNTGDPHAYALTVQGKSMEPVYRQGDVIVISPEAPIRLGDRVIARTTSGETLARQLARRTARCIDLTRFNPDHPPQHCTPAEIVSLHRIVWASQ